MCSKWQHQVTYVTFHQHILFHSSCVPRNNNGLLEDGARLATCSDPRCQSMNLKQCRLQYNCNRTNLPLTIPRVRSYFKNTEGYIKQACWAHYPCPCQVLEAFLGWGARAPGGSLVLELADARGTPKGAMEYMIVICHWLGTRCRRHF